MRRSLIQAIGTLLAVAIASLMFGGALKADCGPFGCSGTGTHFGIVAGGSGPIRNAMSGFAQATANAREAVREHVVFERMQERRECRQERRAGRRCGR